MQNLKISKYLRWVLGSVLLIAGILKILVPDNLVEVLLFFDLLSENNAYLFVYIASVFEVILAINLFFQFKPKLTSILVSGLCIIFLLISIVGYTNDWEIVCGCLGEFTYGSFDIVMVIRNTVLMGMALWICFSAFKKLKTPVGVN